jgi:two-component system response regulator HupR/HoxA
MKAAIFGVTMSSSQAAPPSDQERETESSLKTGPGPGSESSGVEPQETRSRHVLLIVDDEPGILETLAMTLSDDARVLTAPSGQEALEILEREDVSLVLTDQRMPGISGVDLLARARSLRPDAVRILLTGYADVDVIADAINRARVYRYIHKPWEPNELRLTVKRALEAYDLARENRDLTRRLEEANLRLREENVLLRREAGRRYRFDQVIGQAPAMQRLFDLLERVADTTATVLLTGETGTGKDLVARAIHYQGPRSNAAFVAQNCGALPESLLESELFGHRRGAFTSAVQDKRGLFEVANGGTIFLDEIGETSAAMQVRLLRVLENGEIRPLGSSQSRHVDVRVIAATNSDLRQEVEEGRFRQDLFYRLNVVHIHLPPLRERREDIPLLSEHFLELSNEKLVKRVQGLTRAAIEVLLAYPWPGNVRELANEIERAVALSGSARLIDEPMLSDQLRRSVPVRGPRQAAEGVVETWDLNRAVEGLKRRMIASALEETGTKSGAAQKLGIPRQSLQKMIKRLGIE